MKINELLESANYAENLAARVYENDPDLQSEDDILNAGFVIAKEELGAKRAQYNFAYDEDFASDYVSAYRWEQRNQINEISTATLDKYTKAANADFDKAKEQDLNMNKTNCCPFCQTETTEAVTYSSDIKFGRRTINVAGLKKAVCTSCGSESVSAQMHDENLDLILKAEESTQGAVTPGLLRALREQWNLTQVEASKLFGAGKSSWYSGV